ncbi:MAG TPA: hypothetical protein PKC23_10450, partial [Candidatus Desulfobacillus sp.]|nr:hypothetical protein [Candidatus Desulfobacillus sp.]
STSSSIIINLLHFDLETAQIYLTICSNKSIELRGASKSFKSMPLAARQKKTPGSGSRPAAPHGAKDRHA